MSEPAEKEFSPEEFKWDNRLLFVFAPDAADARFKAQSHALAGKEAEILDRDIVFLKIFETAQSMMDGIEMDEAASESLRRNFRIAPGDYAVILVGKDGFEKLRSNEVIPAATIFALIDSMPMRIVEMRERCRKRA